MSRGQASEETLRIRKLVKIERLKGKIEKAQSAESERRGKYAERLDKMQIELKGLEQS
jgi:hypothetical protein